MNEGLRPLPWQQSDWQRLTTLATNGKLAHALLVAGPQGVGKRHFVHAFTSFLLCEQRGAYACEKCRSCLQILAGHHPNAFTLQRQTDEKTGKPKRDIAIEQLRELSERMTFSTHYGQARVAVIDPADALNVAGANALLKTIEEPSQNSFLMLISERPQALLPTLRSRCQRLRMSVPENAQALAWLGDGSVERDALMQAGGAPLKARRLLDSGEIERSRRWAVEMLAIATQKRDPIAAASVVSKDEVQNFLEWLLGWLTRQLREKLQGNVEHLRGLEQMVQETLSALQRLRSNANPQLQVESLMVLWWRVARSAVAK